MIDIINKMAYSIYAENKQDVDFSPLLEAGFEYLEIGDIIDNRFIAISTLLYNELTELVSTKNTYNKLIEGGCTPIEADSLINAAKKRLIETYKREINPLNNWFLKVVYIGMFVIPLICFVIDGEVIGIITMAIIAILVGIKPVIEYVRNFRDYKQLLNCIKQSENEEC